MLKPVRIVTRVPAFDGTAAIFIGTFMMLVRSVTPAASTRPTPAV
jgi:hypothetical protein